MWRRAGLLAAARLARAASARTLASVSSQHASVAPAAVPCLQHTQFLRGFAAQPAPVEKKDDKPAAAAGVASGFISQVGVYQHKWSDRLETAGFGWGGASHGLRALQITVLMNSRGWWLIILLHPLTDHWCCG